MRRVRILITAYGTRGDIQPYVAIARGLQRAGHHVDLAVPGQFRDLVAEADTGGEHPLTLRPVGTDLLALVQDAMPRMRGARDALRIVRQVKDAMAVHTDQQWAAAEASDPDLVVHHPKCLAGPTVAERLGVPGVMSLPLPFATPTRAYPNPVLFARSAGPLNRPTYAFTRASTLTYVGMVNRLRRRIGLPPLGRFADVLRDGDGNRPPVLYPYSRHVVPVPADYPPTAHVTGDAFLPHDRAWRPDPALADFLDAGEPPVYVGFGSMGFGKGAEERRDAVLASLRAAGVRGIVATGWGGLAAGDTPTDDVLVVDAVPHDWLFGRVAAVVHHGGAGSTAAGLAAGRPTLVCPFLGDQPFWGARVHALGAGPAPLRPRRFGDELTGRLRDLVGDPGFRRRAAGLGEAIRGEDGVARAVEVLERLGPDRGTA
jgi:sterol 3beta-glucosyltransferase